MQYKLLNFHRRHQKLKINYLNEKLTKKKSKGTIHYKTSIILLICNYFYNKICIIMLKYQFY